MKPRLKLVEGEPVAVNPAASKLEQAKAKFGRKFAHEAGSDWQEYPESVLTRYFRKADWHNIRRGGQT